MKTAKYLAKIAVTFKRKRSSEKKINLCRVFKIYYLFVGLWGCAVHVDDTRPTKKRLACVFNMILTLDFVKGKLFKEFKSSEAVNGEK